MVWLLGVCGFLHVSLYTFIFLVWYEIVLSWCWLVVHTLQMVLLVFLVFVLSYYVSLRSYFRVVISVTISACKGCSVCLYLQLFVGGLMSYLCYLCLLAYSGVQHILFCLRLVYPLLPVSLDCPFLIVLSVFSNVYIQKYNWLIKRWLYVPI
jgi:hypothetical protein